MAAAATSAPKGSFAPYLNRRHGGAHRVGCWPPSRVAAASAATTATTAASSPEAAAPLKADLSPAAPVPLMRVVPESLKAPSGSLVAVPDRGAADGVGSLDGPGAMEYLTAVLTSKVYDVAIESPLEDATKLSKRLGVNFLVKREDKQKVIIKKLAALFYILRGFGGFEIHLLRWGSGVYLSPGDFLGVAIA
jgi:threonine dehydratase